MTMSLTKDGKLRAYEERLVEVWPALSAVEGPALPVSSVGQASGLSDSMDQRKDAAVFDPKGQLAPLLKQVGFAFAPIPTLDAQSLAGRAASWSARKRLTTPCRLRRRRCGSSSPAGGECSCWSSQA